MCPYFYRLKSSVPLVVATHVFTPFLTKIEPMETHTEPFQSLISRLMVTIDIHKNIHQRSENLTRQHIIHFNSLYLHNDYTAIQDADIELAPIAVCRNFRNCIVQVAKVTKLARSIRYRSDAVNPRLRPEKSPSKVYSRYNIA